MDKKKVSELLEDVMFLDSQYKSIVLWSISFIYQDLVFQDYPEIKDKYLEYLSNLEHSFEGPQNILKHAAYDLEFNIFEYLSNSDRADYLAGYFIITLTESIKCLIDDSFQLFHSIDAIDEFFELLIFIDNSHKDQDLSCIINQELKMLDHLVELCKAQELGQIIRLYTKDYYHQNQKHINTLKKYL